MTCRSYGPRYVDFAAHLRHQSIARSNFSETRSPSGGITAGPSAEQTNENVATSEVFSRNFVDKPLPSRIRNSTSLRNVKRHVPISILQPNLPVFLISGVTRP